MNNMRPTYSDPALAPAYPAVVALGSNLDDPAAQVQAALAALARHPEISVRRSSSLYRTAPVGYPDQPDFINAVALIDTTLTPMALLEALLAIEETFGRRRSFRNAPRTLDLDVIDYAGQVWNTPLLTLPHPRAVERAFVMVPLAEIAPDYRIDGLTAAHRVATLGDQAVARLDSSL